jgi:hypothetical protein
LLGDTDRNNEKVRRKEETVEEEEMEEIMCFVSIPVLFRKVAFQNLICSDVLGLNSFSFTGLFLCDL